MPTPKRPRIGRPPGGEDGTRIQDYPRVMLRLPPATVAKLKAWSFVRGEPVWKLIDEAINQTIDSGEDAQRVRSAMRSQRGQDEE